MTESISTTAISSKEIHDVLTLLNTMAQSLGVSTFPYSRPVSGPTLNIAALKDLMDEAISLLEGEEEETTAPSMYNDAYHVYNNGQWSASVPFIVSTWPVISNGGASGGGPYTARTNSSGIFSSINTNPQRVLAFRLAKVPGWKSLAKSRGVDVSEDEALCAIEQYIITYGYLPHCNEFTVMRVSKKEIQVMEKVCGVGHMFVYNKNDVKKKPFFARTSGGSA